MIAIIFEVEPADGHRDAYLDIARQAEAGAGKDRRLHLGGAVPEHHQSGEDALALLLPRRGRRCSSGAISNCIAAPRRLGAAVSLPAIGCASRSVLRDYGLTERAEAPGDSRSAWGARITRALGRPGIAPDVSVQKLIGQWRWRRCSSIDARRSRASEMAAVTKASELASW